jgi:hypothetical protein
MLALLTFFIMITLLMIAVQDFRERMVSLFLFPCLSLLFFLYSALYLSFREQLINFAITAGFMVLQYTMVTIYFSIKAGRAINLLKQHIGSGDVLFLLVLCLLLSPVNYFVFYLFSLLAVLIYELPRHLIQADREYKIPLAGIQSLLLSVWICLHAFCRCFDLTNDENFIYFLPG